LRRCALRLAPPRRSSPGSKNPDLLYGTGAIKLDQNNELVRVGGVKYTIKDGIIYDARKLLADMRRMVRESKDREKKEITQL
jgi:hypothetical protein